MQTPDPTPHTWWICIHSYNKQHLSNYRINCSFKNLTLSGQWLACVQTFWSINALFTEKPISNSCRMISAVSFRVTHSFWNSLSNWLWTLSDTHNRTDGFLQMAWLHAGGDQKPFISTKAFFLLCPRPRHAAGGTPHVFKLQLTLPTAMEILSWWHDVNPDLINLPCVV